MRTLLLAPHYDDETLFASYTIMRHQPDVMIVACPNDAEEHERRDEETAMALEALGHLSMLSSVSQREGRIDLELLVGYLTEMRPSDVFDPLADRVPKHREYDRVFAPAVEEGGHDDHNIVGRAALQAFGADRVIQYLTYTRHGGRSRSDREVGASPEMIQRKLRALACHGSQIEHPARRPWFYDQLDMREWYA